MIYLNRTQTYDKDIICKVYNYAFSIWGMTQVKVEYDITTYLPNATDTKKAIEIMEYAATAFSSSPSPSNVILNSAHDCL